MQYQTRFSDEQMIAELRRLIDAGVDRDLIPDKMQPPNLAGFFASLPRPERDRLFSLARQSAGGNPGSGSS
jgi:hypothetical protein